MAYVEWLRVRKSFTIYAIVLFAGAAFMVLSASFGIHHAHRDGSSFTISSDHPEATSLADLPFAIPIGWLFAAASFTTLIFSSIVSTSLNKENGRGGFAFTKPVSRETLAITYFAIDLAAIFAAFVYALAVMFASLAALGIASKVYAESGAGLVALAGLGVSAMWYGLLQLATAARVSNGGMFVGLSWPFFLVFGGLYEVQTFGPIFHGLVTAVDFFNPLGYFSLKGHGDNVVVTSLLGFSASASIAITWTLAVLGSAGAVFAWKRMDV